MPWYEYSSIGGGLKRPYVTVRIWNGNRSVQLVALIDSGADSSLLDSSYIDVLGLDPSTATTSAAEMADGTPAEVLSWPALPLELQFGNHRFPFKGSFIQFPQGTDPENLLGRQDFFGQFIVQFWDASEMMNIDRSPDFPHDPHQAP